MATKKKFVGILAIVLVFIGVGTVSAQTYTDAEARRVLTNAGISVNKSAPATSLEGIHRATIGCISHFKECKWC